MTNKIKALGLALLAIGVLGAFLASAADAVFVGKVTKGGVTYEGGVELTGEQTEGKLKFTVDGSSVECTTAKTSGTGKDGETWAVVHPTYEGCTAFGFVGATISSTGCNLEAMATEETSAGVFNGELKIACETGKAIIISAGGVCEAKIGSQTLVTGTRATNVVAGEKMHVTLDSENSPVKTAKTKDGFGCPFNGTGETNGTINGKTTAKAYPTGSAHTVENQLDGTISP